jgi:hypothetical protein
MKNAISLFFDFSFLNKLVINNQDLFIFYDSWAFRSTMKIENKIKLIASANTKMKIIEAISILQHNYCVTRIKQRNIELEIYLKQRMDSS